jgi:hypothetical protein
MYILPSKWMTRHEGDRSSRLSTWWANRTCDHDSIREGATIGTVVATAIWIWIAAVDAITGSPFYVFRALGGAVAFTALHFLLNVIYGIAIVSIVHAAARAPSMIIALLFGFVVVEIAFAMLTVFLSNMGLGDLAWLRVFGGSLVGATIAFVLLSRKHPLVAHLRRAEDER